MNTLSHTISEKSGEFFSTSLVIVSATLYGFLGYFGASLLNLNFSIPSMLFWRFAIATLWMIVAMGKSKDYNSLKAKNIKSPLLFLALSSICYCTACTFYFMASRLTGTGIAMVIYFAYPMFVVLMVMLKEKKLIDKNTCISLIIIVVGLFLLKGNSEGHIVSKWGVFFALCSALFFACYVYCSKFISNKLPSNILTLMLCFSNAVLFLIVSLATHSFMVPTTLKMWVFATGLGVIATALPIQLMLEGLKIISASKASIVSALEPAITLFVGMLLLNEYVTHLQILGAFTILFSAIYIQFSNQKLNKSKESLGSVSEIIN